MKCPSWTLVKTEHYFKLLPIWWMGKWHLNALIIISSFSPSVSPVNLPFIVLAQRFFWWTLCITNSYHVLCCMHYKYFPPSLTTDQLVAESVTENTYEQSHEAAGAGALRRTKTLPWQWQWRSSSTSPPGAWSSLTVNWGEPLPLSSKNFWESSKFS